MRKRKTEKAKKGRLGWQGVAIVVMAVVMVGMGVFGVISHIGIWRTVIWDMHSRGDMQLEMAIRENHGVLSVSDDGNWFIVPEARLRAPFFVPSREFIGAFHSSFRYFYSPWLAEEGDDNSFTLVLTHYTWQGAANRPDGSVVNHRRCVGPFKFFHGMDWQSHDWWGDRYEKVAEIELADGRVVELAKSRKAECGALVNSVNGEFLLGILKRVESF